MELTIEQALQQGVAAHNAGNLQEAERAYQVILQSQSKHPDANHNLGLIAISMNQVEAALPLFKTALDINPMIEQFWVSYIDALVKANQLKVAKQAIKKAKKKGFDAKKLQALLSQSKGRADTKVPSAEQLNSLLKYYQTQRYSDAEKLAMSITQEFPKHQLGWKVLGALYGQSGRNSEAVNANQKAIALSPEDTEAHSNLGNAFKELGRLEDAEVSYRQAIELKSDYAEAHSNLGVTLQELDRLDEAEASYTRAIALKPKYAEAHYNLGVILKKLGRLDEAEASYTQAIAVKPDYAEAHSNLGVTLQELGKLDEAEASLRQVIALKPYDAAAHSNLGIFLYSNGDIDSGIDSFEKANVLDPKVKVTQIVLSVLRARHAQKNAKVNIANIKQSVNNMELIPNPLILHRSVEPELVANLYDINTRELDKTTDERFGNGKTTDWNLFDNNLFIMDKVVEDLISIIKKAFNSDIFIADSFFNILSAGSGSNPHTHLNVLDKNIGLNLASQKHVFQYYLRVGDQSCSEPGIYKLYEPNEEILPSEGMVIIIPAGRRHSAVYGGKIDRVMIGINFYTL